jgi:predicted secreted hydrolase
MAHFALTDVANGTFTASSRLGRGALGLAGATAQPFRVWLDDWSARGAASAGAHPPMQLTASDGDVAIDLTVTTRKPPVLHGERGLSRKGRGEGNASYYYSLTRLATDGHVRIGDARVGVTGTSWMDREWSTSALESGQVGWDWFAIALDDGRELMLYRLRRADGSIDPFSAGTLVGQDGSAVRLTPTDVTVDVLEHWTSRSGVRYPSRWRLTLPAHALTLDVAPRVADQEWIEPVRYWEGAVEVRGTVASRALTGQGYVELVGYAPSAR